MRACNQWVQRWVPGLGVALWSLLFLGCAGQSREVGELHDHGLLHVAVPFFADDTDQCGPAVLASVLTYWGFRTDPVALKEEIYLPRLKGTLPLDLMLAAQARGL